MGLLWVHSGPEYAGHVNEGGRSRRKNLGLFGKNETGREIFMGQEGTTLSSDCVR